MIHQATSLMALSQMLFTVLYLLINARSLLQARHTALSLVSLTWVIAAILLLHSVLVPEPGHWLHSLGIAALFPVLLLLNLAICRPSGRGLTPRESVPAGLSQPLQPQESREQLTDDCGADTDLLRHAMESERLYADPALTIGRLARHLGQHEYRVRRLINKKLSYRNFNHYLNHYRIAEVAHRLRTCQDATLPIAAIARNAGFASLSSFNKAFREIHGVTPSMFRSAAAKVKAPQAMST